MGSKLATVAAVIALAATAYADDPKDLFKQGVDLYKAGKYEESARALKKSYDADPNPNTLFALAQSERLLGECKLAAQHYKTVITQVNDLNVAKLVQQNLDLCEKREPSAEPAKPDDGKKPEPQVVTKVVTRDVGKSDKLAIAMATLGAVSLGVGGGLFLAAGANKDAADKARTLDDHNSFADKASSETTASYVAIGAGAAMLGFAVYRWVTASGGEATPSAVSIAPTPSGAAVSFSARW